MSRFRNTAWRVRDFFRRDAVLAIACVLAVASCVAVPPDAQYAAYIDWRTLGLLFSLMVATSGLARAKVLSRMCRALVGICGSGGMLVAALTALAFFTSMVVTNDVALIAFVPLALAALREAGMVRRLPFAIVCMTIAANMGSMLTPIGNPQNIYLLSASGMEPGQLVATMAPYSVAAAALLAATIGVAKLRERKRAEHAAPLASTATPNAPQAQTPVALRDILPWVAIIVVCLLCVARIAPVGVAVAVALALALAFDRRALRQVDYALLLTFAAFFVFVGNIGRIEALQQAVAATVGGHALLVGAAASQVISNVPAAIMLSGFTSDWSALLVGVNIGGLGTLIASMASLISYRQIAVAHPQLKGRYLRLFLVMNFAFLAALLALAFAIGVLTNCSPAFP
jgi:Na+/H+ antiporter NhaD/arsenite permease-like protein